MSRLPTHYGFEVAEVDTTELLTQLPDCVLVLNQLGEVQWGNRVAEQLFGRSLQESIGFPALELVHPDDIELVLRSLESVQKKEVGTLIEVRAKTPSGWRLLEVIGSPVAWPTGGPAVLFCMRDLTERRRFEVARSNDAAFRSVVQNSPGVTILLSESGAVESVSGAFSRILGHDPELVEGRHLVDFVLQEDRPAFIALVQAAFRGATASTPFRARVRLPHFETGEPIPFDFTFANLLDDQTVGGFIVSGHDITAQVTAERELHQSQQRFRRVFDQGPLGIVLSDFELRIVEANDAFCHLVGRPFEQVIGTTMDSFVRSEERQHVRVIGRRLEGEHAKHHKTEFQLETSSRQLMVVSVTASVVQDENGVPLHCIWVLEDITQRKVLEQELVAHAKTATKLLASLTSREMEILELLGETSSASDIAFRLTVSVRTVESHLANAYRKLGVHNRAAALAEFDRLSRAVAGLPAHWV
jgi:PAS domain S-box-containing protein